MLMRKAIDSLNTSEASGCVLLGDPNYYGRFGFKNVRNLVFPQAPAKYFQALKFREAFPVGEVEYHRAFASES